MYKTTPPGKLLPHFDCSTCLKCYRKVVLTISEVKPFLAGQLWQVNVQKSSSLTIVFSEICSINSNKARQFSINCLRAWTFEKTSVQGTGETSHKCTPLREVCYFESMNVVCEGQACFRKGYSTMDNVINLKCLADPYLH